MKTITQELEGFTYEISTGNTLKQKRDLLTILDGLIGDKFDKIVEVYIDSERIRIVTKEII